MLCACFKTVNRDYGIVVARDICASMNRPGSGDAALKLIEAALGSVIDSDDVVAALRPASAALIQGMRSHGPGMIRAADSDG